MSTKYIFTGYSPNQTKKDVALACKYLFFPWNWNKLQRGNSVQRIEDWLKNYFKVKHAFCIDSGRSSLFYALKSLGVGQGDEVLVQAFTCMVVINAIRFTGAKPVYVDIDDSLNLDTNDLKQKISRQTKVVIVQHTFGIPADIKEIVGIAKERNIKIVEDCAHSIGADIKGRKIGTFGDIAMFSFGSDKVISCTRGGAVITNDSVAAQKLEKYITRLPHMPKAMIIQHLLHYPIFYIGKKLYGIFIGKAILIIASKFNIINKIIYKQEKKGKQLLSFPSKLPNCLAHILENQIKSIDNNISHRKTMASYYLKHINNDKYKFPKFSENAIYLRFPIMANQPGQLLKTAKNKQMIFGDWYRKVVAPIDIDDKATEYSSGICKKAEHISEKVFNLPTNMNISKKDAEKIVKFLNNY